MTSKEKRPRAVTITLLGVLFLGTWNAAKAAAIAQQLGLMLALNLKPNPHLLLIIAAGWTLLFWGSAVTLWRRQAVARWLIPFLLVLYALYELVLQGLYVQIPLSGQGWLLRILLYDVAVLFALWSLNRSKARSYFVSA